MTGRERPLSPHLGIYRPMYTMVLSISHRITGLVLSIGLIVLIYWLIALADGRGAYSTALESLRSPIIQWLLLGWLFSFFFHLCNGLRHLAWDCGFGFERKQARASGWVVVISALTLTALCAIWIVHLRGATACMAIEAGALGALLDSDRHSGLGRRGDSPHGVCHPALLRRGTFSAPARANALQASQ